jgi:hypothetical protein
MTTNECPGCGGAGCEICKPRNTDGLIIINDLPDITGNESLRQIVIDALDEAIAAALLRADAKAFNRYNAGLLAIGSQQLGLPF